MKRLPAILCLFLSSIIFLGFVCISNAEAAAARVGAGGTGTIGASTTLNVTIPATTAGNTLIAVVGLNDNNGSRVTGITGGGTWVKAISGGNAGGAIEADIWYCPNISAGVTTVTITINSAFDIAAIVQEYSGVLTTSPLDKTARNNTDGSTTSETSGTTSATARANELWVGGFAVQANTTFNTPGAGWAIDRQVARANVSTALLDNMSNAAGIASASVSTVAAGWHVGTIATFQPASACPGGNWTVSWADSLGQSAYSLTAPCVAFAGVPFNITANVNDSTCSGGHGWVATDWAITDNGTTIAGGGYNSLWVTTNTWQTIVSQTYAGSTNANHTIVFSALDLGPCNGVHGYSASSFGSVTVDPAPPVLTPNIRSGKKYAWAETSGWINFADANGGVAVMPEYVRGYAWAENIGWIDFAPTGGGVTIDPATGKLLGYAWSETSGWINLAPSQGGGVTFDAATGKLSGYAWGENIGWVRFKGVANDGPPGTPYGVAVVQFTINLNPASGGSIGCLPSSPVTKGWDVTCTTLPPTGYYVSAYSETGTPPSGGTPQLLTYTINNIDSNHSLWVAFEEYMVKRIYSTGSEYLISPDTAVARVEGSDESILLRGPASFGTLDLSQSPNIFFEGGYPSGFGDNTGLFSTIIGQLIFSNGAVTLENIIIQ